MIIDKLKETWTAEETEKLYSLTLERNEILVKAREETHKRNLENNIEEGTSTTFTGVDVKTGKAEEKTIKAVNTILFKENIEKYDEIQKEIDLLTKEVEERYKKNDVSVLLKDAMEIIDSFELSDFRSYINEWRWRIARIEDLEKGNTDITFRDPFIREAKEKTEENYINCFIFFASSLSLQVEGTYERDKEAYKEIDIALKKKISQWYKEPVEVGEELALWEKSLIASTQYRRPSNYVTSLTKVGHTIFKPENTFEDLADLDVDVAPQSLKGRKSFLVTVGITPDPNIKGLEKVTAFDMGIHNSVMSIARENPHGFFTAKQVAIFNLYGNRPTNNNPSKKSIEEAEKSIETMRHVDLRIDYTEHLKLNKKIPENTDKRFIIKNYMIPAKEAILKVNGQELKGYKLIDNLPLEEYGQATNQQGSCEASMLDLPINMDNQKISIRNVLIDEINHMQNNKNWNRTITIDRLLKEGGEDPETVDRKKKAKIVSFIKQALSVYKERKNIKGYTINKQGKSNKSITIEP